MKAETEIVGMLRDGKLEFTPQPTNITFFAGDKWALRITKDCIESNPEVPADDGAKAIIEALSPMIRALK